MWYTIHNTFRGLTMELAKKRQDRWLYPLLAFLLPVLGFFILMMIRGFIPFGDTSMLYSDMYYQYYPFFLTFRRALLSGDSLLWNWEVGMGLNYLSLIAYYLASPLNLLCVFVPEQYTLHFFSLLVPIKLGFASLFFSIFLSKLFRRYNLSTVFFGLFYAFCAWALGYQWNVMWLDSFAILPLVVLGTVSLLRDRKIILYTVTLFLAVLSNYYIGLFICIFVALIFLCYQICCFTTVKRFFEDFGRIFLFSALAIGMTAFLELPAFMALQTTQSSINAFPEGFQLNIAKENTAAGLLDAMRQVAGNVNGGMTPNFVSHLGLPNLYCGVITTVLAVLFMTSRQIKLRERICCVSLLIFFNLSFIFRQLDYIWHGFHFTNMIPYRFSFLYSFVMLYMAYRAYLLRHSFRLWQLITAGIFMIGIVMLGLPTANLIYWLFNGVFILLYFAVILLPRFHPAISADMPKDRKHTILRNRQDLRRISSLLLLCVMTMEIIMNLLIFGLEYAGVTVDDYPQGTDDSKLMIQYLKERNNRELFYRMETTHTQTLNDGALNNYNGISAFTSSANVSTTRFTQALGLTAKDNYNRYSYEEGSPITDLFLNLKYLIERNGADKSSTYYRELNHFGTVRVLENTKYLPLGFLTNPQILNLDFDNAYKELSATHGNWNNLTFQNKLFRAATGIEKNPWSLVIGNHLSIHAGGATLSEVSQTGTCIYQTEKDSGGTVIYTYTANKPGFVCLDLYIGLYDAGYNPMNKYSVWKNGVELYNDVYNIPQVLGVADVEPGDIVELHLECLPSERGLITTHCGILDPEVFQEGYEVLNRSTLHLTAFENNYIEGEITCHQNGVLYTSIPQDGNWVAYVDGKPADIIRIGDSMVGLILREGKHTVVFQYENNAFYIGLIVSAVSFITLLCLCYISYHRKKTETSRQGD